MYGKVIEMPRGPRSCSRRVWLRPFQVKMHLPRRASSAERYATSLTEIDKGSTAFEVFIKNA